MARTYLHLQIPAKLKKLLQRLADRDDRTLSEYVRRLLRLHVEGKR